MAQLHGPSAKAALGIAGALVMLSLGGCEAIYDDTKGWANRLEASLLEAAHELSDDPDAQAPAPHTPEVVEPRRPARADETRATARSEAAAAPARKPTGLVRNAAESLLAPQSDTESDTEPGTAPDAEPAKETAPVAGTKAAKGESGKAKTATPPLPKPKPQMAQASQEKKPPQDKNPEQPAKAADSVAIVLHLSSLRSEAAAKREWSDLKRSFPAPLGTLEAEIRRTELGNKGTFYRVLAGPLPSHSAAKDACAAVKARNVKQYCRVLPSEPAAKSPS